MKKLASLSVQAVPLLLVLSTKLRLIISWQVGLSNELLIVMSIWALLTKFTISLYNNISAHFCFFHFLYLLIEFGSLFLSFHLSPILIYIFWLIINLLFLFLMVILIIFKFEFWLILNALCVIRTFNIFFKIAVWAFRFLVIPYQIIIQIITKIAWAEFLLTFIRAGAITWILSWAFLKFADSILIIVYFQFFLWAYFF